MLATARLGSLLSSAPRGALQEYDRPPGNLVPGTQTAREGFGTGHPVLVQECGRSCVTPVVLSASLTPSPALFPVFFFLPIPRFTAVHERVFHRKVGHSVSVACGSESHTDPWERCLPGSALSVSGRTAPPSGAPFVLQGGRPGGRWQVRGLAVEKS